MGKEPHNITRLVRKNTAYEAADRHARYLMREDVSSQWHVKDLQRGVPPMVEGEEGRTAKSFHNRAIPVELQAANDALKRERAARMRELFDADRVRAEAELNAMGLSLVKQRD